MKNTIAKLKRKMDTHTKYVTFELLPPHGSFFPDLDVSFVVNGQEWRDFGAQYDGEFWRVTLYGVPVDASIELKHTGSGKPIDARIINDNEPGK